MSSWRILNVFLNGITVPLSNSLKYLGVTLDSKLTFESHIKILESNLSKAAGIICKLKFVLPKDALIKLYSELGTRYWAPAGHPPLFGKKSSGAAAYRYSNKKVAPLPLLACKKINSTKNDGIQKRYLMVKF